jgi:hypothetical protein
MIVTPRMGAQYLLWFVPFLIARPTRFSRPAIALAAVWAGLGYIYLTHFDAVGWWQNHQWWSRSSIAVIALLILAMPWNRRRPAETIQATIAEPRPLAHAGKPAESFERPLGRTEH